MPAHVQQRSRVVKSKLILAIGLIATILLAFWWASSSHPYLLENPAWLLNKPSSETILQSLPSARKIDYRPLRSLLQAQQWEEADRVTQAALMKIIFLEQRDRQLLRTSEIQKIPCTDLLTIDRLWNKFSNGRFGFSIQKRIVDNDSRLLSPEEIKQRCLRRCPQEIIRTIQSDRCQFGCESQRIEAAFARIPDKMGRGGSKVSAQLPDGYYPSPLEVVIGYQADTYRELAKRVAWCHI